jgi:hypothetical protein
VIVEDFVMLGKTVPECSSDGRMFVCSAGVSLELRQLIRIYPLARQQCPKRWSVARAPLERNPKDSRGESWKIRGDRSPGSHARINQAIELLARSVSADEKKRIVELGTVRSIREANERRLSLAFVFPRSLPRLRFEAGDTAEMAPTPDMFGRVPDAPVSQRFGWHPRLEFDDADGDHNLMLRDWGCYEFLRKQGDGRRFELEDALSLEGAPPLFVGNLNRFRASWLIISVLSGACFARPEIADRQPSLFENWEAA